MTHSADCALVAYGHLDPATLKQPLVCDCDEEDQGDAMPDEDPEPSNIRPIVSGPTATLTGDAARTFKAFQSAEVAFRAAQKRRDEALRAFTEAVTR